MTLPLFAGAGLDRAGERRTDAAWLAAARAAPETRTVVVTKAGVAVTGAGDFESGAASWGEAVGGAPDARLARISLAPERGSSGTPPAEGSEADPSAAWPEATVFLGIEDGVAVFAVGAGEVPEGTTAVNLRDAASLLPASDAALAAYATAILNWHRTHRFCANCGHATDVIEAGFARKCPSCGRTHHPRTDPVVIMLVTRGDDEVLLGRQPSWPPDRYSALAGFVEPGEALEEAVAREVFEEAGVGVTDTRYVASQPWPFPANLMLGFTTIYAGGEAAVHDKELEDVRWFTRAEVRAATERDDGPLKLPPPLAIARNLIDHWLEDTP